MLEGMRAMLRRRVGMLFLGAVLLHVAAACEGGPDAAALNPQPLPPGDTSKESEDEEPTVGGSTGGGTSSSSGSSGSSGTSGVPASPPPSDAGADADADQ